MLLSKVSRSMILDCVIRLDNLNLRQSAMELNDLYYLKTSSYILICINYYFLTPPRFFVRPSQNFAHISSRPCLQNV